MADSDKPFHNPFGALSGLRDQLPDGPAEAEPSAPPTAAQNQHGPVIRRAVIRIERSGRGGKEVTIVEHLALGPADRERWIKALKSSLGCGGQVDGDALLLQGDQRKRLPALLTARGVRKVTMG